MASRREFIKLSGVGISSLALSACSSIDRFFLGDKRVLDEEVLIIGGGLTGLAAAYQLKKMKVPYRLVEASHRLGGRVMSSSALEGVKSTLEFGASHFYEHNAETLELMKELRLEIEKEKHFSSGTVYVSNGRDISKATLQGQLLRFNAYFSRKHQELQSILKSQKVENIFKGKSDLLKLDSQSLDEVFEEEPFGINFDTVNYIYDSIQMEFGTSAANISAFSVVLNWPELRAKYFDFNRDLLSIRGGNEQIIKTLFERVSGVVPDYLVRKNYRLIEIKDLKISYELTFQTPKGQETLFAQKVLFALPPQSFKDIKGIQYFEEWKDILPFVDSVSLGEHIILSAKLKKLVSENSKGVQRLLYGDGLGKLVEFYPGSNEILMKGHSEDFSPEAKNFEKFLTPLNKMFTGSKLHLDSETFVVDWSKQRYIKGSRPLIVKNKAHLSDWFFSKRKKTNIMFAGDWVESQNFGTLAAALHSGVETAKLIGLSK